MTQLRIEQSGQEVENVSESLVKKLYDTALEIPEPEEGEDDNAYMSGHISVPYTYKQYVDYLADTVGEGTSGIVTSLRQNVGGRFSNLRIDVTNGYYIPFEDPNMQAYLNSIGVGSNGGVTTTEASTVTVVANSQNTTVTKFNELKYFTSITESKDGWNGTDSGNCRFMGWTALEEIDISNFTSLGHTSGYAYEDTFYNCTSLKKVTASNKLTKIGFKAFYNCSNLEEITGLSGTIDVVQSAFNRCSKLTSDSFQNCVINCLEPGNGTSDTGYFSNCSSLTSITMSLSNTVLYDSLFQECSSLISITGLDNITDVRKYCFSACSSLKEVSIPNTVHFNMSSGCLGVFRLCTALEKVTLGDCTNIGNTWAQYDTYWRLHFYGCTSLHTVDIKSLSQVARGNGDATFYNCPAMRNFIIRSTTVPTVEGGGNVGINNFGGSNVTIYVPDAAVNDYKNATGWSEVASYIKGLSEYTPIT